MRNVISLIVFGTILLGYGYPVQSAEKDALLNLFNGNTLQTREVAQEFYQERELDFTKFLLVLQNIDFNQEAVVYLPKLFAGLENVLRSILKNVFEEILDTFIAPFMNENLEYAKNYLTENLKGISLKELLERIPTERIIQNFSNTQTSETVKNEKTFEDIKNQFRNALTELQDLMVKYKQYEMNGELNTEKAVENAQRRTQMMQILEELSVHFEKEKVDSLLKPFKEAMARMEPPTMPTSVTSEQEEMKKKKMNKLHMPAAKGNAEKRKELMEEIEKLSVNFDKEFLDNVLKPIKEQMASLKPPTLKASPTTKGKGSNMTKKISEISKLQRYGYPVESSAEDALLNLFNGNTLQTRSLVTNEEFYQEILNEFTSLKFDELIDPQDFISSLSAFFHSHDKVDDVKKLIQGYKRYEADKMLGTKRAAENEQRRNELMKRIDELSNNLDPDFVETIIGPIKNEIAKLQPLKQGNDYERRTSARNSMFEDRMSKKRMDDFMVNIMGMLNKEDKKQFEDFMMLNQLYKIEATENAHQRAIITEEIKEKTENLNKVFMEKIFMPITEETATLKPPVLTNEVLGKYSMEMVTDLKNLIQTYQTYEINNKLHTAEAAENATEREEIMDEIHEMSHNIDEKFVDAILSPINEEMAKLKPPTGVLTDALLTKYSMNHNKLHTSLAAVNARERSEKLKEIDDISKNFNKEFIDELIGPIKEEMAKLKPPTEQIGGNKRGKAAVKPK
ncbi:hypothetical protein PGB90_003317 [Kerria lacca]